MEFISLILATVFLLVCVYDVAWNRAHTKFWKACHTSLAKNRDLPILEWKAKCLDDVMEEMQKD